MLKRVFAILLILTVIPACAAEVSFTDVNKGDWFYDNVVSMAGAGWLQGYPDGSFDPNKSITAAEFVSIAARIASLNKTASANTHWAAPLMESALNRGWYDWDEIPPTGESYDLPISRQLAVKIVMKAFAPDARGDYNTQSAKIRDFSRLSGRYYEAVLAAYEIGVAGGDDKGNFNPTSPLTRAEACALITRATSGKTFAADESKPNETKPNEPEVPAVTVSGGVSMNGTLRVEGTRLVNEKGETVVLRGMSSHGLQWFPGFASAGAIRATAERGANLFRAAMYTEEGGYTQNPAVKTTLINAVDAAIALDMYAIIDWHILSDGDPMKHLSEARAFFAEMAERYKDSPAVLYEICNEPNGAISWNGNVKPYAEEIIRVIRAIDSDAVILVGSPTWSQDLHEVAKNPINAENIMYTCHFYSGTHTQWLRDRITSAINSGLPVFVSEWGTSDASGSGGVYVEETERWLRFMNENNISWANWSLCDKNESSAALKPGANANDGIDDNELTESGRLVFGAFR